MKRVLIFAGTSEGRELAEYLSAHGISCCVSVATQYGTLMLQENQYLAVQEGRMDSAQMQEQMRQENWMCVVDATHPYAVLVSREIQAACAETGTMYLRLSRKTGTEDDRSVYFTDTMADAAAYLKATEGNILLTTGSKELTAFVEAFGDTERLYARVLPSRESLAICEACGLTGRHVIAMQGPFSQELNSAIIRQIRAAYLLTKETGLAGGYTDKLQAAAQCDCRVVVIRNPEKKEQEKKTSQYVPYSLTEILQKLTELSGVNLLQQEKKQIILAGIGVGDVMLQTAEVKNALHKADILFGAERVLGCLKEMSGLTANQVPFYQSDRILHYLEEHPQYRKIVVAFSGDTGFYSGATGMLEYLRQSDFCKEYKAEVLCGISSVVYFAARTGTTWQDMTLLSAHGRKCNVIGNLRKHSRCFLLLSGVEEVKELGRELQEACQNGVLCETIRVTAGYQLSYPEEMITAGGLEVLQRLSQQGLYTLLLENPQAEETVLTPGRKDGEFLRDTVPMTKEEIRALSICKLQLTRHAVVYDIGAGSGSVSVEAAQLCEDGTVYAIEHKEIAAELCRKNKEKFALSNLEVIYAKAPDGMEELPAPTHVFIGGSSGKLQEILELVLRKNPAVRIVINAVTLETLAQAQQLLEKLPVKDCEFVQVAVSRAEVMGHYHLMQALNPVFVISCTGEEGAI